MIIRNSNHRNVNQVFDEIFNSFPATWGSDGRSASHTPPVNIYESTGAYFVDLNAPGRSKEEFKINIEKGILTITVEQKKSNEDDRKNIRNEFNFGGFKRSFSLTEKVNTESIKARYENGILNLELPKKEELKDAPKQIQIQ